MNVKKKLGFIGAGNMAEALARGLVENKVFKASELIASDVDAARRRKFKGALKIEVTTDNLKVLNSSRAVLFAVKPQTIDAVLTELARAGGAARATARRAKAGSARSSSCRSRPESPWAAWKARWVATRTLSA